MEWHNTNDLHSCLLMKSARAVEPCWQAWFMNSWFRMSLSAIHTNTLTPWSMCHSYCSSGYGAYYCGCEQHLSLKCAMYDKTKLHLPWVKFNFYFLNLCVLSLYYAILILQISHVLMWPSNLLTNHLGHFTKVSVLKTTDWNVHQVYNWNTPGIRYSTTFNSQMEITRAALVP